MQDQMQRAVLCRLNESNEQALGHFTLFDDTDQVFNCKTLELPDLGNQKDISCIPKGRYKCRKRQSDAYGWHFIVEELSGGHVTGRKWILIHFGNYKSNTEGCILVGQAHTDIDGDGLRDVTRSKFTLKQLIAVAHHVFILDII